MSVIGLSGKMQTGKNTAGIIIQYIMRSISEDGFDKNISLERFIYEFNHPINGTSWGGWQLKSFAYKLKQCISIITGLTMDELEDNAVKNMIMGQDWDKTEHHPLCKPSARCEGGSCGECPLGAPGSTVTTHMTIRKLLQLFGTEVGRAIHPDFWVNALFTDYHINGTIDAGKTYCEKDLPNWIITDVRFPNEVKAIERCGGLVIRLEREILPVEQLPKNKQEMDELNAKLNHPSETSLDNYKFQHVIQNDGTIDDLYNNLKNVLKNTSII